MKTADIRRILVFRNDRLGEFLLIIPALRALKETFSAYICVVVNPYLKEIAECIPETDESIVWEMKKHKLSEILSFANKIRKRKFTAAVIMNPTKEAHLISYLARIPTRVGYDRKWGFLLNKKIPDNKDLALKHEVEYNLELVNVIGAKTEDKSLKIEIPQEKLEEAKKLLALNGINEDYIVIHPFASYPPKQWRLENFVSLINQISRFWNVVIVGGRENIKFKALFQKIDAGKKIANLIGETDLLQLAGILKNARCLISNDSGPVHLACCVETKCIVLFNNSVLSRSPVRWGPWGEGHIVIQKPDINEIRAEEVLNALDALVHNGPFRNTFRDISPNGS